MLVVDVVGVGRELLALPLTARYQHFPRSLPSLLVLPAHCLVCGLLAVAPNDKCCLMSSSVQLGIRTAAL